jgi:alpha-methylacyl-CoA racemase
MTTNGNDGGPLKGLRVLEFSAIGPVPHCGMLLADLGAEILRLDRPGGYGWPNPVGDRGRASITLDIRSPEGREVALDLADRVDVVIEGMRPGVMERLGLGPDIICARNPRLIYGRMTGWGQSGPLARTAGHDINYIALTGALAAIGYREAHSIPPLNLVGDYGGGSLFLAFGIMAALWERERSGLGQVIDAAIVDGAASLMASLAGLVPSGAMSLDRNTNLLGGAAHFYRCYVCADGKQIAVGAIEPQFYRELLDRIDAPADLREGQNDPEKWGERCEQLDALFRSRTRDEWCDILEGTDACFAPVLDLEESFAHPHMQARKSYVEVDGTMQAAPAPRFSRTPGRIRTAPSGEAMAADWRRQSRRSGA